MLSAVAISLGASLGALARWQLSLWLSPLPSHAALPWGTLAETAFGGDVISIDSGAMARAILAVGEQDLDPDGLLPPEGLTILGASGDHLLLDCGKQRLRVGDEVRFGVNYSALVRAMTSPFVEKKMIRAIKHTRSAG